MKDFDVLIIGGGIIGLSIARELKKNGVERVAILERNSKCGYGSSLAAAGMLAPQAEADKPDDFFDLCQQSRDLYPQFAQDLLDETNIDVGLDRTGTFYLAFTENDLAELEHRFEWQRAADLPVEKLSAKEVLELEPNVSPKVIGGLRFPLDWQVVTRKLVDALIESVFPRNQETDVNSIYKRRPLDADAKKVIFEGNKVCGVELRTNHPSEEERLYASTVVIASGAWSSHIEVPVENFNFEVKPIRGRVLNFGDLSGDTSFSHVIYSRNGYIVPRTPSLLFGATAEDASFDPSFIAGSLFSLLQNAFEMSSRLAEMNFYPEQSINGFRPKTPDDLPVLGEFPENSGLYFATGHYRNGILLAPITGKLIAERIAKGVDSPFLQIFNPSRFLNNS